MTKMKEDAAEPRLKDWQALFHGALKIVEPTQEMRDRFAKEKRGTSFIFAQAMREQSPPFYDAMTAVVMTESRLVKEIFDRDGQVDTRMSFGDMRARGMGRHVERLMQEFRVAVDTGTEFFSEIEHARIDRFIASIGQAAPAGRAELLQRRVPA
jgi:hypothetical protein